MMTAVLLAVPALAAVGLVLVLVQVRRRHAGRWLPSYVWTAPRRRRRRPAVRRAQRGGKAWQIESRAH